MSETEQALTDAAELLDREADLIDDWQEERIERVKAKATLLRKIAAQVAALTKQRDATVAALTKSQRELQTLLRLFFNDLSKHRRDCLKKLLDTNDAALANTEETKDVR